MQTKATARVPFRTALKPEIEKETTIHERSVPNPAHRSQESLAAPRRVFQSLCLRSAAFSFIVRSRICRCARDFRHRDISLRGSMDRSVSKHACAGPRPAMVPERSRNRTRRADCLLESFRTLHADWIGLDNRRRLVIVEAKGSFDSGTGTWRGPNSIPKVLRNAMQQAQRTKVFRNSAGGPLPAKRWAVASRWANESPRLAPTLLAWDTDGGKLDNVDYWALWKLLHRADLEALMVGLGHPQAVKILDTSEPLETARPSTLPGGCGAHDLQHSLVSGPSANAPDITKNTGFFRSMVTMRIGVTRSVSFEITAAASNNSFQASFKR